MPRQWHTGKPDVDNLAKALYDALKGIVWRDDSQIVQSFSDKLIAAGDEQPRVEVSIVELQP
jgi:Holliday junction resolvase RusA-like endonuclease